MTTKELSELLLNHPNSGDVSDGFHTFNELYAFRMVLTANLFAAWRNNPSIKVCKSKKHSDGSLCFGGGWFIVVATLPNGQVSFHYKFDQSNWLLFDIEEVETPPPFDGHDSKECYNRLFKFAAIGV